MINSKSFFLRSVLESDTRKQKLQTVIFKILAQFMAFMTFVCILFQLPTHQFVGWRRIFESYSSVGASWVFLISLNDVLFGCYGCLASFIYNHDKKVLKIGI